MPTVIIHRVKSFWLCSREQLYQSQWDVPASAGKQRSISQGWKHGSELGALGSTHPLNWNPKSYRSAAIHTGLETGTFKTSMKVRGISELNFTRQRFAPLAVCPHRGGSCEYSGFCKEPGWHSLIYCCSRSSEEKILSKSCYQATQDNTFQWFPISNALYLNGNGQSQHRSRDRIWAYFFILSLDVCFSSCEVFQLRASAGPDHTVRIGQ